MTTSPNMRPPLCFIAALALSLGCNSSGSGPSQVAEAVRAWSKDGIAGDVKLHSVSCNNRSATRFRCQGQVQGGGTVVIDAERSADGFDFRLAQPIVVASRIEKQVEDYLAGKGLEVQVECGDRVRTSAKGDHFKCAVEDAAGKVVNAANVTITDDNGTFDAKLITSLVSSDALEKQIGEWLAQQNVGGQVDCGQRHRFSTPGASFRCSIAGDTRRVQVAISDFRGNVNLTLTPD